MLSTNETWVNLLHDLMIRGDRSAPRGKPTREALQYTTRIDMLRPVLTVPARQLGYRFMAAEAFWILSGDNRVATIAPYSQAISQFSDDGLTFAGAYGPPLRAQLPYIINKLLEDPDTRQAVATIWRPHPRASKDIPCTVAFTFMIRAGLLHLSAYMRSSDAWLGWPYDVFNFSMLATYVTAELNARLPQSGPLPQLRPGTLFLTAANQHLYEINNEAATEALACPLKYLGEKTPPTPQHLYASADGPANLMTQLEQLREVRTGSLLRWWEVAP